jgi:hypothetical protein
MWRFLTKNRPAPPCQGSSHLAIARIEDSKRDRSRVLTMPRAKAVAGSDKTQDLWPRVSSDHSNQPHLVWRCRVRMSSIPQSRRALSAFLEYQSQRRISQLTPVVQSMPLYQWDHRTRQPKTLPTPSSKTTAALIAILPPLNTHRLSPDLRMFNGALLEIASPGSIEQCI